MKISEKKKEKSHGVLNKMELDQKGKLNQNKKFMKELQRVLNKKIKLNWKYVNIKLNIKLEK